MRISLVALTVVCFLAAPSLGKADAIYTFTDTNEYSWSFEVPGLITTPTTITTFLSTNVVPGSFIESGGIGSAVIDSVTVTPQGFSPHVFTFFLVGTGGGTGSANGDFSVPLTAFGTFSGGLDPFGNPVTLTISPSLSTPEPASLLLLGIGLLGIGAWIRLHRPSLRYAASKRFKLPADFTALAR